MSPATKPPVSPGGIFRKRGGVLRISEALAAGLNRRSLYALRDAGTITQLSRGVYRLASLPELEAPDLVTVATRVPGGVVSLISALAYHELTTQIPHAVDIALPRGAERPRIEYPAVNFYWFSGTRSRVYRDAHSRQSKAPDLWPREECCRCLKYRSKLGLDVALEALRMWRARRGANTERLLEYARACRVERVMRPYLEPWRHDPRDAVERTRPRLHFGRTIPHCMLGFSSMSGEIAAKAAEPVAMLHAVDRNGHNIDLEPAWPLLDRVLREWNPERIQLFGSRARGEATPDSDWDILVVVPEALAPVDPLVPWRLRRDTGVRADVIVYSSSDFEAERDVPNTLAYEAASAGVALYER